MLLLSQADAYVGADLFDGLGAVVSTSNHLYHDYTPLPWAAIRGYTQMVSKLLGYQQPINGYDGFTILLSGAASCGREGTARLLIEKEADINAGNPLAEAARNGYEAIVRLLIENGVDVNAADNLGCTAIAQASPRGNTKLVELLLRQSGADIAVADRFGNTPLDAAVRNRHYDVTNLLLRHGATL